jgi:hypothetical protein
VEVAVPSLIIFWVVLLAAIQFMVAEVAVQVVLLTEKVFSAERVGMELQV